MDANEKANLNRQQYLEQKYRDDMIKRLHNNDCWLIWADGYLSCPICGLLLHPTTKIIHIIWHEQNNI